MARPAKPLRAAVYARVSTADQQTLPAQVAALRRYCADRGWPVVVAVEDVGSGAQSRPRREELLGAARRREVDVVCVWRLDRWGRSLPDLVHSFQELSALGVGFVSLTEALDLTTPAGRALAGMLAVFAEFERDILVERIRLGMARAAAGGTRSGRRIGRPRLAPALGARARALRATGLTPNRIARQLGIGRTSVRRLLAPPDGGGVA